MVTGSDALKIEVIQDKLNHWCKKNNSKVDEKKINEKALVACVKQFRGRYHKCGQIGHILADPNVLIRSSSMKNCKF